MTELKCMNCGLKFEIANLLTKRCPRCGFELSPNCFGCSGDCLKCVISSNLAKKVAKK